MKPILALALSTALTSAPLAAQDYGSSRQWQYGTELRRLPGFGTYDIPMLRGESSHPKRRAPPRYERERDPTPYRTYTPNRSYNAGGF